MAVYVPWKQLFKAGATILAGKKLEIESTAILKAGTTEITGTNLGALIAANSTVSALVTSGFASSKLFSYNTASPVEIMEGNATGEGNRVVVIIVECITKEAHTSTSCNPIIGETGDTDKFFATSILDAMDAGDVKVACGTLVETKDLIVTIATGDASAGQWRVTVFALPAEA